MSNTTVQGGVLDNLYTLSGSVGWSENDWKENRWWLALAGILALYTFNALKENLFSVKAPVVGHRSFFEPEWLLGFRFVRGSAPIIQEGYEKYKSSMFKVQRNDAKILVIPHKHVDELRNMPESKVSAIHAHLKNLLARYIGVNLLLESDLHTRVLQTKLTPILATTIPTMIDEMDFAMESEIPDCNDKWVPVHIQEILLRIVARTSARIFVGADLCRNEEWLSTSINYTENIFETVITLRGIPSFLHPIVSVMLPSYWRVRSNLATAKRFICPMVTERREKEASGDVDYQKPKDLLQMMMDAANEAEGQPGKLAHRQLLLSLASIHTTTMQAAHALYDLCAHPEHFQTLRQEISAVMAEDGGFHKTTLNKLRKMDSLLKESQRMNPPSLLAFNRLVISPLTLSDGTYLPANTHFAMASDAILHDQNYLPGGGDPATFDPFRYSKLRDSSPENANKYQFATTESSSLHFGHGKYACPGRFFASNEIKLIMSRLLLAYEFKYPEGQGRPVNISADENLYPDPEALVLIRKRKVTN